MRKIGSFLMMLMLSSVLAFAQTRTVTGVVRDDKGDPVPYATVTEAGTRNAVQADANGNFSIKVGDNARLAISATGFTAQTISVNGNTATIALARSEGQMQEVVVTALGQRRTRNQVPYAAQQVGGDEVSKTRTSNFTNALSGKVAGLEIRQGNTLGGSTNVVIRGNKSISGNNQALFVIDGVPVDNTTARSISATTGASTQARGGGGYDYGNAAADINPDDIESITVLKGAASTALYGSRGGNGVILITTKKGRGRGLGITVNSGVTIGKYDKSTFAKYQKEYGAGYYGGLQDPSGYFGYRDVNGDGTPDLVVPTQLDASHGARFDPNLMVYHWDSFDPSSPNFGKARPWVAAANDPSSIFQTAVSSNQSVLFDGGSEKGFFKLGYTRTDDKGIMPNSKITKNLVNFGGSYNVTSKLTAGINLNYSNIAGRGRYGTGYEDRNMMTTFRQWWQTNVDVQEQKDAYFRNRQNITWNWRGYGTGLTPQYADNPYWALYENYGTDGRNRFIGNTSLNYKPTEWLSILGRISTDFYSELQEERFAVGSHSAASYKRTNHNFRESNYDLMFNFDRDLSSDINVKALLGTNVRDGRDEYIVAQTNGGLVVPRLYSLSNTKNAVTPPYERDEREQVWGNYAGATFTWRDMVTLDATIRNDQSSTLPKGENSYWYPSVSGGFTFSKLLPSATWLSYGKLRANYAQVGNDATPYSVRDVYTVSTGFGSNPVFTVPGTAANLELVPERTSSYEFGVEASFLKNRVGFDVTYYNAKTFDQIFPVPVSTSTGYNSKWLNAGNVRNKGVELSAFGTPVQTRDFSWTANVNWTRNRSKVEELAPGITNVNLGGFVGGVSLNAPLGQPFGILRSTDFVYHENGQPIVGADGYYLITPTSNNNIGDINPDWVGGINNTLRYKNASLSFLVDMRKGGDVYSLDMSYGLSSGLYPETAGLNDLGNPKRNELADGGGVILPGVTEDGKPNTTRISARYSGDAYGYDHMPDKGFVYDASYVKLREVVFSYSLPKSLVSRLRVFQGIDLSVVGRNLWIIHKNLPYADPEENTGAGNFQGYQVGAYPTTKTLGFNIKLRF